MSPSSIAAPTFSPDKTRIAYFTMEVGISHSIPTYAGGLGILAGDTLKSFADLGVPVAAVTLLNQKGYFYQRIDSEGNQQEQPLRWDHQDIMDPLDPIVSVRIEGREVKVRAWRHLIRGQGGCDLPVYFLDSDLPDNAEPDRALTSHLYGGDRAYRLSQEIVLGIGGVRMLRALGYSALRKYHMNEGHAALLTLELSEEMGRGGEGARRAGGGSGSGASAGAGAGAAAGEGADALERLKSLCVFTTHTPVAAGHDRFDLALFERLMGPISDALRSRAVEDGHVNMTLLGLNSSRYVNGVAKRHGEVTREMYPNATIHSITNGIHAASWAAPPLADLFDQLIPGWSADPFSLRNAMSLPADRLWGAHQAAKKALVDAVNLQTNAGFHSGRFTLGYARRFTEYKRPDLLLSDLNRLERMAQSLGDVQVVFAGKAHSQDGRGKELLREVWRAAREVNARGGKLRMAFLENYDMRLSKLMVSGSDVWLNTPQQPYEASGTSGMKAALNGVPQLSTLDGWWLEGHIEDVTGWSIGLHPHDPDYSPEISAEVDAADLYDKLEGSVLPAFYSDREKWVGLMRHCIALNGSFFNTHRMAQQYIAGAYLD